MSAQPTVNPTRDRRDRKAYAGLALLLLLVGLSALSFAPLREALVRVRGYGRGLAICRELVEAHGAMIRLDPSASQGARFEFTLPAPAESDRPASAEAYPRRMDVGSLRSRVGPRLIVLAGVMLHAELALRRLGR